MDAAGSIVAYNRPMAPEKLAGLARDTHLGRMLGVWSGRILEETLADEYNKTLVQALKTIHDEQTGPMAAKNRSDEFVNVADPKNTDPVVRDAWNTMGWQIKQDAAEIFGRADYMPIRKDMINDAMGYRSAGVTDPWTGVTRFSPKTQEQIQKTMTLMLGNDAFKRLSQAEKLINNGVSYAKTTVIVRSLLVGVDNIMSNVFHLKMHGIGCLRFWCAKSGFSRVPCLDFTLWGLVFLVAAKEIHNPKKGLQALEEEKFATTCLKDSIQITLQIYTPKKDSTDTLTDI